MLLITQDTLPQRMRVSLPRRTYALAVAPIVFTKAALCKSLFIQSEAVRLHASMEYHVGLILTWPDLDVARVALSACWSNR